MQPSDSTYIIICGFRRVAAIRELGIGEVEAKIMYGLSRKEALGTSLSENLERHTLTAWDLVSTALRLREEEKWSNEEVGEVFGGVSIRSIQRYCSVARNASPEYQGALQREELTIQQVYEAIKNGVPSREMLGRGRSVRYLRNVARKNRLAAGRRIKPDVFYRVNPEGEIRFILNYIPGDDVGAMIKSVRRLLSQLRSIKNSRGSNNNNRDSQQNTA